MHNFDAQPGEALNRALAFCCKGNLPKPDRGAAPSIL